MEIIVTVPDTIEEHLRKYAASIFYETTPYAISRAIVYALVNQLDTACLVSRDEIVSGILETNKLLAVDSQSVLPVSSGPKVMAEKALPNISTESLKTVLDAPASPPVLTITDPKKLKVPGERFQGSESNTWLVWGWCIASSLNLVTSESGVRKFRSFNMQDVVQGVLQKKGILVKDPTVYSALDVMTKRQWLTFNSKTKQYTLSSVAQRWAQIPNNHSYLVEKGFLDPIQ